MRQVTINAPSALTPRILARVREIRGIQTVTLNAKASVRPDGDVVQVVATNEAVRDLARFLREEVIPAGGIATTSSPSSNLSEPSDRKMELESDETIWEESVVLLRRDTNPSPVYFVLMGLTGIIAAAGLWSDQLHLVVGAMVLAPGFEPFLRMSLGAVTAQPRQSWIGFQSFAGGYAALASGAAAAFVVARLIDGSVPANLEGRSLVPLWSTFNASGWASTTAAAAAGAYALVTQRHFAFTGVMIALAVVPTISLAGMAATVGAWDLMGRTLLRWTVDVFAILFVGGGVLAWRQLRIHRTRAAG